NVGTRRGSDRVFLSVISGVPWQDIATLRSLNDDVTLDFVTARELVEPLEELGVSRWQVILGEPGKAESRGLCPEDPRCGMQPVPPLDPFMIQSIAPRDTSLFNPLTADAITSADSTDPFANAINGHEIHLDVVDPNYPDGEAANDDLQYSCIFELPTPRADCPPEDRDCDCRDEPLRNRPTCQAPAGGPAS